MSKLICRYQPCQGKGDGLDAMKKIYVSHGNVRGAMEHLSRLVGIYYVRAKCEGISRNLREAWAVDEVDCGRHNLEACGRTRSRQWRGIIRKCLSVGSCSRKYGSDPGPEALLLANGLHVPVRMSKYQASSARNSWAQEWPKSCLVRTYSLFHCFLRGCHGAG